MRIETFAHNGAEEDQVMYEVIKAWAPESFPIPELLPKLGVIVFDDLDVPICFLCADMSNSIPRAMLDCLQTNPAFSKMTRWNATKLAEEFLCEELKTLGYSVIIGVSQNSGVAWLSQKLGYWVSPQAMSYFHKSIV